MKYGELKVQALRLMFAGYDDISVATLHNFNTDDNYNQYLIGMNGAIDRCFSDIESKKVLPIKRQELSRSAGTVRNGRTRYDLSALMEDFSDIVRVSRDSRSLYRGSGAFDLEGKTLILSDDGEEDQVFTVLYRPKIPRSITYRDTDDLPLPDEIACAIPYYIKGDLYRDDEPREATEARNYYEAAMEQLRAAALPQGACECVEDVYGGLQL